MQERLRKEIELRKQITGYFLIISDDKVRRKKFVEEMKEEFPEIEFLYDYNLSNSVWDIWDKLKTHSVMLLNFEEKLDEYVEFLQKLYLNEYEIQLSRVTAVYTCLVRYREYARDNPLIILCTNEVGKEIIQGGQVRDFVQRLFLDKPEYKEETKTKIKKIK